MAAVERDGIRFSCHDSMSLIADDFYHSLLGSGVDREFGLDLDFLQVGSFQLLGLEEAFSAEEIWQVVKEIPPDKSPGPDGFTGRFYTSCWGIIKDDIVDYFRSFSTLDSRGLEAVNQAAICLLPKTQDAVAMQDFRPISLVHGVGRILAKALANRLAPELPRGSSSGGFH